VACVTWSRARIRGCLMVRFGIEFVSTGVVPGRSRRCVLVLIDPGMEASSMLGSGKKSSPRGFLAILVAQAVPIANRQTLPSGQLI